MRGVRRCTASCAAGVSPTCDELFRAGGPPFSSYVEARPPATTLACVAGWCEWIDDPTAP
jgi:hypothetical protein